ncbi:MAG TPA: VTT domain-containing protein, partial [Hyphomicrobiaceae bacterium]|nr:VTT domain-containing protein [Hyphomicrobiaceae bacterium]
MDKHSPALCALRRYGPLAVVAGVTALVLAAGWHNELTLENIVATRDRFHDMLAAHQWLAVLIYIAVYALAVALSLPCGLIMTLAGGLLFGWLLGGVAAVIGATTGATLLFMVARSAIGETLGERAAPWLTKLRQGFKDEALSYMLFLRLVPAFPFWLVNIAPAVLGVPLRTYILGTFLGIIPATFAFATVGAGLDSVIRAAKQTYALCVAQRGADACTMKIHTSSFITKELLGALVLLG